MTPTSQNPELSLPPLATLKEILDMYFFFLREINTPRLLYQHRHGWTVSSEAQRHAEEMFNYGDVLQGFRSDVESGEVALVFKIEQDIKVWGVVADEGQTVWLLSFS